MAPGGGPRESLCSPGPELEPSRPLCASWPGLHCRRSAPQALVLHGLLPPSQPSQCPDAPTESSSLGQGAEKDDTRLPELAERHVCPFQVASAQPGPHRSGICDLWALLPRQTQDSALGCVGSERRPLWCGRHSQEAGGPWGGGPSLPLSPQLPIPAQKPALLGQCPGTPLPALTPHHPLSPVAQEEEAADPTKGLLTQ